MSEPTTLAVRASGAGSYWSIVGAQLRKNRVAMAALAVVRAIVVLAIAAPLVAMNAPLVSWIDGRLRAPLLESLFDRFLFAGGVDVFFNLLLVLLPVWSLARRIGERFSPPDRRRPRSFASRVLVPALFAVWTVYLLFGAATGASAVARVLAVGGAVGGAIAGVRAAMTPSRRASAGRAGSSALVALFVLVFCLLLWPWRETRPVVDWIGEVEHAEAHGESIAETTARHASLSAMQRALEALAASPDAAARTLAGEEVAREAGRVAAEDARIAEGSGTRAIWPLARFHYDNVGEKSERSTARSLDKPGWPNVLGCDGNGRDVMARLVFGSRISLTIGLVAVAIFITIGVILGSLGGYYQGKTDLIIMRLVEVMICFPTLFLLLTIVSIFESRSVFLIMAAIGLVGWPGVTRLVRAEFLRQRNLDYVVAARSQGIPERKVIFGHVLPNCVGPVLVSATFGVASAILIESGLAFLGLGDPSAPSWGQILNAGRSDLQWHLILAPGIAIFVVVLVFNLLGEGIRDALDPKMRR